MIDIIYKIVKPSHLKKLQVRYKQLNVPSHLHIFRLNFDKANHRFFHSFLLFGETGFRKNAAWGNQ